MKIENQNFTPSYLFPSQLPLGITGRLGRGERRRAGTIAHCTLIIFQLFLLLLEYQGALGINTQQASLGRREHRTLEKSHSNVGIPSLIYYSLL